MVLLKNLFVSSIRASLVGSVVVVVVVGASAVVLVVVMVLVVASVVSPLLSSAGPGTFPVLVLLCDLVLGRILLIIRGSIGISVDAFGSF